MLAVEQPVSLLNRRSNRSVARLSGLSTRTSRRLLALGSGGDTGVSARLTFRAVLAALLWLLRELDLLRRDGLALLAGPRRVVSSKSRHAKQRNDQSQNSHGVPQDGRGVEEATISGGRMGKSIIAKLATFGSCHHLCSMRGCGAIANERSGASLT
jgi:hypothetical protein